MVCGPTASGKSEVSDAMAEALTEAAGAHIPTIIVDSMQVYKELPVITNQARRRPAHLVGIASVSEEWTVATHKARAEEIIAPLETPFVLDAGTGMYLNAILMDIPLAPKVPAETRRRAQEATTGAANPRRAARKKELELFGAEPRGSIWDGDLIYETVMIYLRPKREVLDAAISLRSRKITHEGLNEALKIEEMAQADSVNPSVLGSIGVRELLRYLAGQTTLDEAREQICTRTRRLARRQMQWFDKLARILEPQATVEIVEQPDKAANSILHCMRGRIGT